MGSSLKKQFRIERQGAGQGHSLLHAAADFRWLQILKARQPYQFQFHLNDQVHDFVIDPAVLLDGQGHILADGERLQQGAGLKENPETGSECDPFPAGPCR